MISVPRISLVLALCACLSGAAYAQSSNPALTGQVVYCINSSNGALVRRNLSAANSSTIGYVCAAGGNAMTGIQAVAYFPGFGNAYALWNSPADGLNKLVYINVQTGTGSIAATNVEGGVFTGATTGSTATNPYVVYAIQAAKIKPPSSISGLININPNNSASNEFTLTEGNGTVVTAAGLNAKSVTVAADGTYYQGTATLVHVKPKGNGNQNGLIIDGNAYALQNSNTYDFSGSMQVRLYNDKVNGNLTAMGHWWINIISGQIIINDVVQVLTPNRIAQVDQHTGVVTEIMVLSKTYNGLATSDGVNFYTTLNGSDLYLINTATQTETKVGTTAQSQIGGMEYLGSVIVTYDGTISSLLPVNPSNASSSGTAMNPGLGGNGPIFLTPSSNDPFNMPAGLFD